MKHLVISDEIHTKLRLQAIHKKQTLLEVTNEILSEHLNETSTQKGK